MELSAASAEPQTAAIGEATEINANATATTTAKQAATTSTINNSTIAPENGWNSDHTAFYQSGKLANGYVQADDGNYYMFKDGIRQKGVQKWMGTYYYFDPTTYLRVDNDYREQVWKDSTHDWYMFGNDGRIVQGFYNWKGSLYYFDNSTFLKVINGWRDGVYFGNDGRAINPTDTFSGRVIS